MPSSLNGTGVTFNDGTQLQSANDAGGNYILRTFTSPTTWTKPAGLKAVKVSILAGGGGGGGCSAAPQYPLRAGPGGQARDLSEAYISAPSIPGPVAVTVGAAGTPGTPGGGSGGAGGTSSFGSFISATGGAGGQGQGVSSPFQKPPGAAGGLATGPAARVITHALTSLGTTNPPGAAPGVGVAGAGRGSAGSGAAANQNSSGGVPNGAKAGGVGAGGFIVVEEFF